MMMNIYLTNLGKYNEGELVGEWVQLPISNEELQKVFEKKGTEMIAGIELTERKNKIED